MNNLIPAKVVKEDGTIAIKNGVKPNANKMNSIFEFNEGASIDLLNCAAFSFEYVSLSERKNI